MPKLHPVVYGVAGEADAAGIFERTTHQWLWSDHLLITRIVAMCTARAAMVLRYGLQKASSVVWLGHIDLDAAGYPTDDTPLVLVPAEHAVYLYGSGFTAADKIQVWIYGLLTTPET